MDLSVLQVHNYYRQPGGEDPVVSAEAALLTARGHTVNKYTLHNNAVAEYGRLQLLRAAFWNQTSYATTRRLLRSNQASVMHVHNTFPLISPSVYYAAESERVGVVQTLHNYRLLCPSATFLRNGRLCEKCASKPVAWPSVVHSCYRNSRAASGVIAAMQGLHWARRTYTAKIHAYIVMTRFSRDKFIAGGLPPERIFVKPHFIDPDPGAGDGNGAFALYVGRLASEKGVLTLLEAWDRISSAVPLKLVGDGPLAAEVQTAARRNSGISWLGQMSKRKVFALLGNAKFLVVPSISYETFGLVVIEAFAKGTPVIGSGIGAIGEVIDHGRNGRHARPGDPDDLCAQVEALLSEPGAAKQMRREAREEYLAHYTADRNYDQLMQVYDCAMAAR